MYVLGSREAFLFFIPFEGKSDTARCRAGGRWDRKLRFEGETCGRGGCGRAYVHCSLDEDEGLEWLSNCCPEPP